MLRCPEMDQRGNIRRHVHVVPSKPLSVLNRCYWVEESPVCVQVLVYDLKEKSDGPAVFIYFQNTIEITKNNSWLQFCMQPKPQVFLRLRASLITR
jgi:hypothetical protein